MLYGKSYKSKTVGNFIFLRKYGVTAERKSIYDDLEAKGIRSGYYNEALQLQRQIYVAKRSIIMLILILYILLQLYEKIKF